MSCALNLYVFNNGDTFCLRKFRIVRRNFSCSQYRALVLCQAVSINFYNHELQVFWVFLTKEILFSRQQKKTSKQ